MTQSSAYGPFFVDKNVFADEAIDAATRAHNDMLIDDTLFMAARWAAAGNDAAVSLWPGGAHAFQGMDMQLAAASNRQIDAWMGERIARA